jgi:hypothetical protein
MLFLFYNDSLPEPPLEFQYPKSEVDTVFCTPIVLDTRRRLHVAPGERVESWPRIKDLVFRTSKSARNRYSFEVRLRRRCS